MESMNIHVLIHVNFSKNDSEKKMRLFYRLFIFLSEVSETLSHFDHKSFICLVKLYFLFTAKFLQNLEGEGRNQ